MPVRWFVSFHLPRSVLHKMLPAEDHRHVDATVVEHVGPVFDHPDACVLVDELIFKVENVRVVWRDLDVHFGGCLLLLLDAALTLFCWTIFSSFFFFFFGYTC